RPVLHPARASLRHSAAHLVGNTDSEQKLVGRMPQCATECDFVIVATEEAGMAGNPSLQGPGRVCDTEIRLDGCDEMLPCGAGVYDACKYDLSDCMNVPRSGTCTIRCRYPYAGPDFNASCPSENILAALSALAKSGIFGANDGLLWDEDQCVLAECPDPNITEESSFVWDGSAFVCRAGFVGEPARRCSAIGSPPDCRAEAVFDGCVPTQPCTAPNADPCRYELDECSMLGPGEACVLSCKFPYIGTSNASDDGMEGYSLFEPDVSPYPCQPSVADGTSREGAIGFVNTSQDMNVSIHSVSGRKLQILVRPGTAVLCLKAEIARFWQIPEVCQNLLLGARTLHNKDLLSADLSPGVTFLELTLLISAPPCCASRSLPPSRVVYLHEPYKQGHRSDGPLPNLSVLEADVTSYGPLEELGSRHRSRKGRCACQLPSTCPHCKRLLLCVGNEVAAVVKLHLHRMAKSFAGALNFLLDEHGLCLHEVDGCSTSCLSLEAESLQSFDGITAVFPKVTEFSYRGEWSGRGRQGVLRSLRAWRPTLRSLRIEILPGESSSGALNLGSIELRNFSVLEDVRLHLPAASRRHLAALSNLTGLRQLIFWGTDEITSDRDLKNKAYGTLDFSGCQLLKLLAFRSMAFCLPDEQDHHGCMALALPSSLEELVIVNDMDALSGLTPRLRRDILGQPFRLAEYAPEKNLSYEDRQAFKLICTATQTPRRVLWEVDASFTLQSAEEMEAARECRLQMLADQATEHHRKQIELLAMLGLKPSRDAPFHEGEMVWYISILGHPLLRRCCVRRVAPTPRDGNDEFAYDNIYLTYLLVSPDGEEAAPTEIEADPMFIFRSQPTPSTFPGYEKVGNSWQCAAGYAGRAHVHCAAASPVVINETEVINETCGSYMTPAAILWNLSGCMQIQPCQPPTYIDKCMYEAVNCEDLPSGGSCAIICRYPFYSPDVYEDGLFCPQDNVDPLKEVEVRQIPTCELFCPSPPPPPGYIKLHDLLLETENGTEINRDPAYTCAPGWTGTPNHTCSVNSTTCAVPATLQGCFQMLPCMPIDPRSFDTCTFNITECEEKSQTNIAEYTGPAPGTICQLSCREPMRGDVTTASCVERNIDPRRRMEYDLPTCNMYCPAPEVIPEGYVHLGATAGNVSNSTIQLPDGANVASVEYRCAPGYAGLAQISCHLQGSYSSATGTVECVTVTSFSGCAPSQPCVAPVVDSCRHDVSACRNLPPGQSCEVSCTPPLVGLPSTFHCPADNVDSTQLVLGELPSCRFPFGCEEPVPLTQGYVKVNESSYECAEGYVGEAEWDCYLARFCAPMLILSGCHELVPCALPAPEDQICGLNYTACTGTGPGQMCRVPCLAGYIENTSYVWEEDEMEMEEQMMTNNISMAGLPDNATEPSCPAGNIDPTKVIEFERIRCEFQVCIDPHPTPLGYTKLPNGTWTCQRGFVGEVVKECHVCNASLALSGCMPVMPCVAPVLPDDQCMLDLSNCTFLNPGDSCEIACQWPFAGSLPSYGRMQRFQNDGVCPSDNTDPTFEFNFTMPHCELTCHSPDPVPEGYVLAESGEWQCAESYSGKAEYHCELMSECWSMASLSGCRASLQFTLLSAMF
ncbi:unnamed protein product, partial [Symbiodinium necroappetens]